MNDRDSEELRQFGYAQHLRRSMGAFTSFALAFSLISVFTGVSTSFGLGAGLILYFALIRPRLLRGEAGPPTANRPTPETSSPERTP
jgi:hypothetical protein